MGKMDIVDKLLLAALVVSVYLLIAYYNRWFPFANIDPKRIGAPDDCGSCPDDKSESASNIPVEKVAGNE